MPGRPPPDIPAFAAGPPGPVPASQWRPPVDTQRRGRLVAIVGMLVALVVSVVLVADTRPPTALPNVPAGQFVGASGHREFLRGHDGSYRIIETSHLPGAVAFLDAPYAFQLVLVNFGFETSKDVYWVVETTTQAGSVTSELFSVAGDGLMLHGYEIDGQPYLLTPGLVEVPFDAEPGETWTSQATMTLPDGTELEVHRQGELRTSELPGCLDITLTDRRGDESSQLTGTRCPDRGLARVGDEQAVDPFAAQIDALDLQVRPAVGPTGAPAHLQISTGGAPITISTTTAPAPLGGGLVLANRANSQLDFVTPTADGWEVQWRRRPGADTLALLGVGDVVVAATTDRTLVAYDASGHWLWQTSTADLAASLVRLDDESLAVVGLDGSLGVHRLANGTQEWAAQVVTGVSAQPAVLPMASGNGLAVVAGPALSVVSPDGVVQTSPLSSDAEAVVVLGQSVLVTDSEAGLTAFSPDGERLWRTGLPDRCRLTTTFGDDTLMCATSTALFGYSVAQRSVVWRQPLSALDVAVVGDHLLVTGRQSSWLLDASGTVQEQWALDHASALYWTVGSAWGATVYGSSGDADWWAAG